MAFLPCLGACQEQESSPPVELDIVWIGVPWVEDDEGTWFLVDTGAPRSVVVPTAAMELEQGSTVEKALDDWAPLGRLSNVPVLLTDATIGEVAIRPEPYGGILGIDVAQQHPLLFDSLDDHLYVGNVGRVELGTTTQRSAVSVERLGAGTFCPTPDFCVPYEPARLVFEVTIEGVDTWAILDTGAATSIATEGLVRRLSAEQEVSSLISTSDAQTPPLNRHRVDLTLGDHEVRDSILGTGVDESLFAKLQVETGRRIEVLLGWSSLDDFAIEIDADSPSLHLHPYLDPPEPRTVHGTGMLLEADDDDCYRVVTLYEEQPAAAAGVQLGDCVTSVNGENPGERSAAELNAAMVTSDLGTTFDVVIAGAQHETSVTLEVTDMLPIL